MTARANSLTHRVTEPAGDASGVWSMPANDVRALLDALGLLGYNPHSLLASAALSDRHLSDPDARISCETLGKILSRAQQERFTPNLGLEVAKVTPLGAYPLLDYLVVTSDTVGAGLRQLARYFRLIGSPLAIVLHEDADPIRVEMARTAAPFSIEFVASLIVFHFRHETEGRFAAASLSLVHTPDDAGSLERALGCPILPASPWNGLTLPRHAWRLPLRRRDPVLRQLLEAQANDALAHLPARTGLAFQVQRALAARVGGGDTRLTILARQFAMSPRTLQRRLASEGASFEDLREDARKEAAGRYLADSTLSIGEVSYLAGYSEPAPFYRAFKRWYGVTPEIFRQASREKRSMPARTQSR